MELKLLMPIYLLFPSVHLQNVKPCNIVNSQKLGDFKVLEKGPATMLKEGCVNNLVLEKGGQKYCISKGDDLLKCKQGNCKIRKIKTKIWGLHYQLPICLSTYLFAISLILLEKHL